MNFLTPHITGPELLPAVRSSVPSHLRPIVVCGPTASGKTDLALDIAHKVGGQIINIDSMQLYRGMDIGTAKIPLEQRRGIPHHLFDVLEVTETASVAQYKRTAQVCIEDLLAQNIRPIIVGGSMLYVQSLLDDWDFPPTDTQVRGRYEALRQDIGTEALHDLLATKDPQAAAVIERADPRRTVRALEVIELTGRPFSASQPQKKQSPQYDARIVALTADANWLNPRLEQRVHTMFEQGLVEEVEALKIQGLIRDSTAGKAIGYSQALDYIDGALSFKQASEDTYIGTRKYARRQRVWFSKDPRSILVNAQQMQENSGTYNTAEQLVDYIDSLD